MVYELERVLLVCNGFLCSMSVTYDGAVPIVIEVGRLWRCLDLLDVTSMSSVLLSLSLSMFAVAQALTSLIHDFIE